MTGFIYNLSDRFTLLPCIILFLAALEIVSKVADHANEAMKQNVSMAQYGYDKLWVIQSL